MEHSEISRYFGDNKQLVNYFKEKCGEISEFQMNVAALYSMLFVRGIYVEKLLQPIQTIENLCIQHIEQQVSIAQESHFRDTTKLITLY